MKKLVIALALFIPLVVMADAPVNNSAHATDATQAITAQHSATTWTAITNVIVSKTDTCNTYYHVTGTAILQPGQKLYIGIKDGPSGTIVNQKTYQLPEGADGPMTIQWGNYYADSLRSQTDASDSIYVVGAVLGTGMGEGVTVTSTYLTGTVIDYDAP